MAAPREPAALDGACQRGPATFPPPSDAGHGDALAGLVAEAVATRLQSQLDRVEARLEALAVQLPRTDEVRGEASWIVLRRSVGQGGGQQERSLHNTVSETAPACLALEVATPSSQLMQGEGSPVSLLGRAGLEVSGNSLISMNDSPTAGGGGVGEGNARPAASQDHYGSTGPPPCTGPLGHVDCLARFVGSQLFKYLSLASVVVFFMLWMDSLDRHFSRGQSRTLYEAVPVPHWSVAVGVLLIICSTTEVVLQLLVYRVAILSRRMWFWIDVLGMLGLWWDFLAGFGLLPWYVITLVPRVVRGAKLFQILALSSELHFMVKCVSRSVSTFCWAFLLLSISLLIGAFFFMQFVLTFWSDHPKSPHLDGLLKIFPSMRGSCITLLGCITGSIDWIYVFKTLELIGKIPADVFCLFIVFMQFSALNVVTSIFVNKSLEVAAEEEAMMEEEAKMGKEGSLVMASSSSRLPRYMHSQRESKI